MQPLLDTCDIIQRQYHPAFQQAAAHGRDGIVESFQQGIGSLATAQQFQVTDRKPVHPLMFITIDTLDGGYMPQVGMFGIP